jgi:hypothetical protein
MAQADEPEVDRERQVLEQEQDALEDSWAGVAAQEYVTLQNEAKSISTFLRSPQMAHLEQTDPGRAVLEQRHAEARLQQLQGQAAKIEAWTQQAVSGRSQRKAWSAHNKILKDIPAWKDPEVAKADLQDMAQFASEMYQVDVGRMIQDKNSHALKLVHDAWTASKQTELKSKKGLPTRKRDASGKFVNRTGGRSTMLERNKQRAVANAGGWSNLQKSSRARDKAASDLLRSLL